MVRSNPAASFWCSSSSETQKNPKRRTVLLLVSETIAASSSTIVLLTRNEPFFSSNKSSRGSSRRACFFSETNLEQEEPFLLFLNSSYSFEPFLWCSSVLKHTVFQEEQEAATVFLLFLKNSSSENK